MAFNPANWIYRQPLTVDNTVGSGGGLFALSNFQVPIALNSGNFAFASANANGSDLVVTADSAGATVLSFWLQAFNQSAQTGTLWVQIPSLAEGATTTIYLWYGNIAQTASLGSYSATMTRLASGAGITELYHCDDGTGSTLAEAGGGTAATVVGGPPTWEAVDGGGGPGAIQYVNVASPDFALTGSGWTYIRGAPYVDSSYYGPNGGSGLNTATWTIPNLPPGTYNIAISYLQAGNRSTAAPFKVYDGASLLTSVAVNQQNAPAGITDAFGTTWTILNAGAVINSGTCVVTLTDNASGYVIAGTVRLAPTLCNAPFLGASISLNGTSQCVTIPGFQGVSMPAAGAIMFWYRNESAGPFGSQVTILSLFANATGGNSSTPGNALWIYLTASGGSTAPQTVSLTLSTWVGGTVATTQTAFGAFPTDQSWHHFCYTWSPAIREVWIDGRILLIQRTNQNGSVGLFNGVSAVNNLTLGALSQEDSGQTPHYSATPTNWLATSLDEIAVLDHQPLPSEIYSACTRRQYQTGMWQDGRWTKQGVMVSPPAWSGSSAATAMEPAVLYLTSLSQVMALTGTGIGELTSTLGGLSGWTDSGGNPTQSGHGSQLYQDGSTYYWFWTDGTTVYAQTSTTALPGSWNAKTTLFTKTTIGQAWATASLWGVCVFRDPNDNTWKALQEGDGSGGYQIGLLTTGSSTLAGATWTPYAGNPLMSLLAPAATWCSHPDVHCNLRGSGTYDLWYHPSYPFDGPGDSLIAHAQSSDLIHWTNLELVLRLNSENFSGLAADQLADPHVYYFNGSCKIYYDIDAEIDIAANIQAATYNNTLANLLVDPPLITLGAGGPILPVGLFPAAVRRAVWDCTGSRRAIWSE